MTMLMMLPPRRRDHGTPRFAYDIFAHFPINSGGVRVARRRTIQGVANFCEKFGKLNKCEMSWRLVGVKS